MERIFMKFVTGDYFYETPRHSTLKLGFTHPILIILTKVLHKPSITKFYFITLYIFSKEQHVSAARAISRHQE
jgi:hypothetical protein